MSATFFTPLPEVLGWPWAKVCEWWHVAAAIDAERWGPVRELRSMLMGLADEQS